MDEKVQKALLWHERTKKKSKTFDNTKSINRPTFNRTSRDLHKPTKSVSPPMGTYNPKYDLSWRLTPNVIFRRETYERKLKIPLQDSE